MVRMLRRHTTPRGSAALALLAMLALALGVCHPAAAAEETLSLAGLEVVFWPPQVPPGDPSGAKPPLIIFSHGLYGCAVQTRFLMNAFAAAGYAVFAPNHRDAVCNGNPGGALVRPSVPFRDSAEWTDAVFRDRPDDIHRMLAAVEADARWHGKLDFGRIGLVGHSLGGYTVLGMAGAWPSWKLAGVKAVLALAPFSRPFVLEHRLAAVTVPVMYQTGTLDLMITPSVRRPQGAYDETPAPKYDIELEGAGHLAWTNLNPVHHDTITTYALAFMNHYVKGAPADPVLTHSLPGVAAMRYETAREAAN